MAQRQRPPPWPDRGDDLKTERPSQQLADKINARSRRAQGAGPPQRTSAPRRPPSTRLIRRPVDATRLKRALRAQIYGSLLRLSARAEKARDALMAGDDLVAAAIGCDILARTGRIDRALKQLRATP